MIKICSCMCLLFIFFFNDTATTEIYTLSLHDALPISLEDRRLVMREAPSSSYRLGWSLYELGSAVARRDRKSTRLNSSHANISYAVFCLKKKTQKISHLKYRTNQLHRRKP